MAIEWLHDLRQEPPDAPALPEDWFIAYIIISAALVVMAGLMSGLTLGLLSLDALDMEVLKRSGTTRERAYAARIEPVIKNSHFLLVTLLMCNAFAAEALPLFLDKLVSPTTAVLLSVSVVLVFGEILPQAVCSRYGLQVGAASAPFVRTLMLLMSPLAWPLSKFLDLVLGGDHGTALFRRQQLKALVDVHGSAEGLGGTLSADETVIIRGALDLTAKTAWRAMTHLDKVFMLSDQQVMDEEALQQVLASGHSRVPIYRGSDRLDILGLILVKELVLLDTASHVTAGELPRRQLPQLPADTPLYDILKLFEVGRSHIALLTKPARKAPAPSGPGPSASSHSMPAGENSKGSLTRSRSGVILAGDSAYLVEAAVPDPRQLRGNAPDAAAGEDWGAGTEGDPVGIITIEDVIEELLQQEIVDETDRFIDNEQTARVDAGALTQQLPPRLRKVLASGSFTPRVGRPASVSFGALSAARGASGALAALPLQGTASAPLPGTLTEASGGGAQGGEEGGRRTLHGHSSSKAVRFCVPQSELLKEPLVDPDQADEQVVAQAAQLQWQAPQLQWQAPQQQPQWLEGEQAAPDEQRQRQQHEGEAAPLLPRPTG